GAGWVPYPAGGAFAGHPGADHAGGDAHGAPLAEDGHAAPYHDAWLEHGEDRHAASGQEELDLAGSARLPWLENGEDYEDDEPALDTRRVIGAAVAGVALLAAVVGGVWWISHRHDAEAAQGDGSLIAAPTAPYKVAPANPGGKTYDGTGDTSFAVSQGQVRQGQLADGGPAGVPQGAASPQLQPQPSPSAAAGHAAEGHVAAQGADNAQAAWAGAVVQVGAYSQRAQAEAAWGRLSTLNPPLKGLHHRVVEGQADIGTVYRLQALTGAGGGGALCEQLRGAGVACQVKH
ncbi:MAG TPA: SPOR domain-containing protein, partial [Novosphingobium sp.]|nr:SPOR domain-containing protein [Novosphingobium sp.]